MARWTGTWLSGLGAAGVDVRPAGDWRGRRFGLPAEGVGAIATIGPRATAFLLDLLVGGLIGSLVNVVIVDPTDVQRALAANGAFALQVLVLTALTGQSLGMRAIGLRVQRVQRVGTDDPATPATAIPGFLPAAIRTALLVLLVPALISDRDGRGLHDKAAGTAVVRARP
jgi:uncharacterized RDD family membrane protein YckC